MSPVGDGPRLSLSTDKSSGAVQFIDAFVKEKGSKMIDVRPKSDRRARGGSWLLMSMLDYERLQREPRSECVQGMTYSSEIPVNHTGAMQIPQAVCYVN